MRAAHANPSPNPTLTLILTLTLTLTLTQTLTLTLTRCEQLMLRAEAGAFEASLQLLRTFAAQLRAEAALGVRLGVGLGFG